MARPYHLTSHVVVAPRHPHGRHKKPISPEVSNTGEKYQMYQLGTDTSDMKLKVLTPPHTLEEKLVILHNEWQYPRTHLCHPAQSKDIDYNTIREKAQSPGGGIPWYFLLMVLII